MIPYLVSTINQKHDCSMATVKIKFRPSTIDGEVGSIFYQVIHKRIARQQKTDYYLYTHEWDERRSRIVLPKFNTSRRLYLAELGDRVERDAQHLHNIITDLEQCADEFTSDDVIKRFISNRAQHSIFSFMEGVIDNLKKMGKIRTSETYAATLRSFKRFRENNDMDWSDMDADMMMAYETHLRNKGLSANSSSFYIRNLRATYNRAVDKGLTTQKFPFKHVYTGVDKTIKRAVPLKVIKQIKELDLSARPSFDFARDMFLFSFYTRGMSFVDMAYLQKRDLANGTLSYHRRKTGQKLMVKWEKCMQEIVEKYNINGSNYLLPIIKPRSQIEHRRQYIYAAHNVNRCLKIIGRDLGLPLSLTMYVARHSWASIAKSKNVPLTVISEGMGHDSEATTRIYLASLDTMAIDKANSMIINSL